MEKMKTLQYDDKTIKKIESLGSRDIVGFILNKLSELNPNIVVAYADVGSRFSLTKEDSIKKLQISIAEQSLIGIISGIYHEGYLPFGVAYAPFLVMRTVDQIRMSIGEMGLGIKLIGGSAGLVSGNLGAASMALDDISIMRSIPNLIVLSPADCLETAMMMEYVSTIDKPVYIRLTGGNKVPPVYKKDFEYKIGKNNLVMDLGNDIVIFATGMQVYRSIQAAQLLLKKGIRCKVIDVHTLKPINKKMVLQYAHTKLIVTSEEHNIIGGLGSAIAECIAETGGPRLLRLGVNNFYPKPDTYENLLTKCMLLPDLMAKKIERYFRNEELHFNPDL